MNIKSLLVVLMILCAPEIALGHDDESHRNEDIHNVIGGYAGGLLGSKIGGGYGRDFAMVTGAALGFRYGHNVIQKVFNKNIRKSKDKNER